MVDGRGRELGFAVDAAVGSLDTATSEYYMALGILVGAFMRRLADEAGAPVPITVAILERLACERPGPRRTRPPTASRSRATGPARGWPPRPTPMVSAVQCDAPVSATRCRHHAVARITDGATAADLCGGCWELAHRVVGRPVEPVRHYPRALPPSAPMVALADFARDLP